MDKFSRRDFLIKSSLLTALLSLPGFIRSEAAHAAGLAKEVAEFAEEAAHVVSTYGDMDGYYSQLGAGKQGGFSGPAKHVVTRTITLNPVNARVAEDAGKK